MPSITPTERLPLPTPERYTHAADAVRSGVHAVEDVAMQLRRLVSAYMDEAVLPEQLPSLADVGALWVFVDTLDAEVDALGSFRDDLRGALDSVETIRRDGPLQTQGGEKDA